MERKISFGTSVGKRIHLIMDVDFHHGPLCKGKSTDFKTDATKTIFDVNCAGCKKTIHYHNLIRMAIK